MTTLAPAPPPRSRPRTSARDRARGRRRAAHVDLLPAGRSTRSTRSPGSGPGALRTAVFPLVVLAVVVGGGWQVGRAVVAAQPMTSTVSSPAASASWGRLVVLGATQYDRPAAAAGADGVVVDLVVRLVHTGGSGRFDPASVVLRRPDGVEVPATLGALAPVRVPTEGSLEGRLGFVTAAFDGVAVLVVRDGPGSEQVVAVRPSRHAGPAPDGAGATWLPGR